MFTYQTKINMQSIDAAGVMFYGHLFGLIHDAYEAFMSNTGISLKDILANKNYITPIVHTEADYKKLLKYGDIIDITVNLKAKGKHSFEVNYILTNQDKIIVATAKNIHAVINKHTLKVISIPQEIKTLTL